MQTKRAVFFVSNKWSRAILFNSATSTHHKSAADFCWDDFLLLIVGTIYSSETNWLFKIKNQTLDLLQSFIQNFKVGHFLEIELWIFNVFLDWISPGLFQYFKLWSIWILRFEIKIVRIWKIFKTLTGKYVWVIRMKSTSSSNAF